MQRNEIFLSCKIFSDLEVRYMSSNSFSCKIFCKWNWKSLAYLQSYKKAKTSKILLKGDKRQQRVVSEIVLLADAPFPFFWSIFSWLFWTLRWLFYSGKIEMQENAAPLKALHSNGAFPSNPTFLILNLLVSAKELCVFFGKLGTKYREPFKSPSGISRCHNILVF